MLLVTAVAVPQYFWRISTLVRLKGFTAPEEGVKPTSSMMGRATETIGAFHIFLDHPILGVGPHQAHELSIEYGNKLGLKTLGGTRRAHSLYLEILADVGIIGFIFFFLIVVLILHKLWKLKFYWATRNPHFSNMATALFFSVLTYLINGIFLHLSYMRYYWFLLAVAGAGINVLQEKQQTENVLQEEQQAEKEVIETVQ